jgi:hypothetical protein
MPRQKAASAALSASPEGAGTCGKKRDAKAEYIALMTWLSDCDNRNIISGAAGAAQNNGGMNTSKLVVSKAQGHVIPFSCFRLHTLTLNRWGMLAKFLAEKTGGTFDSSQAENKYRYYEQKYHKAKLASQVSGFGVDNADREKGIQNIDQKMESLCASYSLWDSWFGSTQKYAPASLVVGRQPLADDAADEAEMQRDDCEFSEAVQIVDAVSGGADGVLDDAATNEEKKHEAATDVQSSPSSGGRQGKAAVGGKSAALVAAKAEKQNLMSLVATSPTSASVGSSSKSSSSNFDQVYASAQAAKSAQMQSPCLIRIYSLRLYAAHAQLEIARGHNVAAADTQARGFNHDEQKQTREFDFQRELEDRKFAFEAQAKALQLAASRADQQADRNVRQRIEFEKNVTQLLTTDPTGKLASDLVNVIDGRFGPLQRVDQHDPVASLLERFMNKYG